VDNYGHGAGGTQNMPGNGVMHLGSETEVEALHRKEAGLVFSSCYVANDAALSTLGNIVQKYTGRKHRIYTR